MTPVDWEQFMMLLEEVLVCGGVAFHPPARPGSTEGIHPCDGSAQYARDQGISHLSNSNRMTPVDWEQFMMLLEEVWFVAVLHSTPLRVPGR